MDYSCLSRCTGDQPLQITTSMLRISDYRIRSGDVSRDKPPECPAMGASEHAGKDHGGQIMYREDQRIPGQAQDPRAWLGFVQQIDPRPCRSILAPDTRPGKTLDVQRHRDLRHSRVALKPGRQMDGLLAYQHELAFGVLLDQRRNQFEGIQPYAVADRTGAGLGSD